jgi:hypothetical protein
MRAGRYVYYGPDAEVVLSDPFLDRHCFWIETDAPDDEPWIGLGFRPRERREVTDIRGVLWLDRGTAELRVLEYRYTPLPRRVPARHVGGRLEFERLPSGAWIIDRWWIRTPGERGRARIPRIEEAGAVVLRARTVEELAVLRAEERTGVITGVVDDDAGAPLPGAVVYLSGTEHRANTGTDGRFRLRVPAGRYALSFHHPTLDSLGVYPEPVEVEVGAGDSVRVRLGPSAGPPPRRPREGSVRRGVRSHERARRVELPRRAPARI